MTRGQDASGAALARAQAGGPRSLAGLAGLAELLGGDSERSRRFLGGLVAGALVGAALAGAALLRRRDPEGRARD